MCFAKSPSAVSCYCHKKYSIAASYGLIAIIIVASAANPYILILKSRGVMVDVLLPDTYGTS